MDKSFSKERSSCKSGGPLSKLLDELGANKVLRFDVVKDAQLALNMPVPYPSLDKSTAKNNFKEPFLLIIRRKGYDYSTIYNNIFIFHFIYKILVNLNILSENNKVLFSFK